MGGNCGLWSADILLTKLPFATWLGLGLLLAAALLAGAWAVVRYGWRRCAWRAAAALTLALLAVGGSYLASLLLDDVIRDAEQVYASSAAAVGDHALPDGWPVWLLLAAVAAAGYFVHGKPELRR